MTTLSPFHRNLLSDNKVITFEATIFLWEYGLDLIEFVLDSWDFWVQIEKLLFG